MQGTTWAGYFMGPVVITSGYLQFPDGSQQRTAGTTLCSVSWGGWQQIALDYPGDIDFFCPSSWVMVGINFRNVDANWAVDQAQIACAPIQ